MAESIGWVPLRVTDAQLAAARSMASALGLQVVAESDAHVMLATERGDIVEYCGPAYDAPAYLFGAGPVVGFMVRELEVSAAAMADAGFAALSDVVDAGPVRYQHFAGPGGVIAVLQPAAAREPETLE